MRARTAEASEQIQRLEANSETTIKDCASQILAFNERNEGITKELQEIVAERAAAKAELKKKNAIVEDAVATITELRNELQCAEEDAEGTRNGASKSRRVDEELQPVAERLFPQR